MSDTLVLYAHPQPSKSRVSRALLEVLQANADIKLHSLYDLYPDFDIDVQAEQHALLEAKTMIWLAPVHWYGMPSLLKHWIDVVLTHGWAYGKDGTALHGKQVWWITSAGADHHAYHEDGAHMRPFVDFVPPIECIARYCGMQWRTPFVVHAYAHAPAHEQQMMLAQLAALCRQYLATDQAKTSSQSSFPQGTQQGSRA